MGTDCKIYLPARARIDDVATVIAGVLGCKVNRCTVGRCGAYAASAEGVEIASVAAIPQCATIKLRGAETTAIGSDWFLYHFEGKGGSRMIILRATGRNIALLRRLAAFFGGRVDFNDCDDVAVDLQFAEADDIAAEDGAEWQALQDRMMAVQPLTAEEVAECQQFAAYKVAA